MSAISDLLARRRAAIEAGDKALGREIYHHLQTLGLQPHEIDTASPDSPPAVLETRPAKAKKTQE